ncbi:MAG: hypothetical protein HY548_00125 [Elusimicrobia bacterium]|nr:hypothetical protein [Elusimicrobiota bacterium]
MGAETQNKELQLTGGFNLQPRTLEEALHFAKLMADSELVPKDYRGKPGNVLIAVQMGAEIGVPPMQAIQNIAVINGRPSIWGDLGKAILLSHGCKIEELDIEEVKKAGKARCKITRADGRTVERTFSIDDAKTAKLWGREGPWTTYPYRQMSWRAFWMAARDVASDLLKGLYGAEELRDIERDKVVETTGTIEMPKRASEVAKEEKASPAPAEASAPVTDPAPEAPKVEETTTKVYKETFTVVDVKKRTDGHFDVILLPEAEDAEQCTIKMDNVERARQLRDGFKGKKVSVSYTSRDGEPWMVGFEAV